MKQQSHGFTLLELMVVVAIVAFLATLAVPRYFKYQARARQLEATIMLSSLHLAQEAFRAEHGTYSSVLNGQGGIGWKPEGYKGGGAQENFYYTYGFNVPGAQEGVHYFTGKLGTPPSSFGDTHAGPEGFVAKAAGDISGKGIIDVWQIDDSRSIVNVQKGVQ